MFASNEEVRMIRYMFQHQPFQWESFRSFPVIGILRGFETEFVKEIGINCFESGLKNIEVTLNTQDALEQIRALREICPPDANVGAGTVIDEQGLKNALEAGASFIVSPVTDENLIRKCCSFGIPIMPGAYTPTEVFQAWRAGAPIVKLFPANIGGPEYVKTLLAPLNQIELMAVGAVNLDNVNAYLKAGVRGVGLGTPLFDKQRMEARDWLWLNQQIVSFRQIFDRFSASKQPYSGPN